MPTGVHFRATPADLHARATEAEAPPIHAKKATPPTTPDTIEPEPSPSEITADFAEFLLTNIRSKEEHRAKRNNKDHPLGIKFGAYFDDGTPRVSPSQVAKVLRCGADYKGAYLDGIEDLTSSAAFFGTLGHAVVEQGFQGYIKTGQYPPTDFMADAAHALAFTAFKDPFFLGRMKDGLEQDPAANARELKECIRVLWDWVQEIQLVPLALEDRLVSMHTVEGITVGCLGFRDFKGHVRTMGNKVVSIDWKFPDKTPSKQDNSGYPEAFQFTAKRNHQHSLVFYCDADEAQDNEEAWVVHIVRNKQPVVRVAPLKVTPTIRAWGRVVTEAGIRKIIRQDFDPDPFSADWYCAEKWCPSYNHCPGSALQLINPKEEARDKN